MNQNDAATTFQCLFRRNRAIKYVQFLREEEDMNPYIMANNIRTLEIENKDLRLKLNGVLDRLNILENLLIKKTKSANF